MTRSLALAFVPVVALVGCGSDPVVVCEESLARTYDWQCATCPDDESWCPPGGYTGSCDGLDENGALELAQLSDCYVECYEERIAAGANVCPPADPSSWTGAFNACVEACAAR